MTEQLFHHLLNYVSTLDWTYIMTFILIAYGINHHKVKGQIKKVTRLSSRTRYRTALIGLLYGGLLYYLRGYTIGEVETLFSSFVFTLVFHKLIIDTVVNALRNKRGYFSHKYGYHHNDQSTFE